MVILLLWGATSKLPHANTKALYAASFTLFILFFFQGWGKIRRNLSCISDQSQISCSWIR